MNRFKSWFLELQPAKQELIRGSASAFLLKIGGLLVSYVFTILVARWLGASVLGLYTLSVTLAAIFTLLGQLGAQTAIVRFVAQYAALGRTEAVQDVFRKGLYLVVPASVLSGAIVFFARKFLAQELFNDAALERALMVIVPSILFGALMMYNSSALRGLRLIRDSYFFQALLIPSLNLVVLLVVFRFGKLSLMTLVIAYVLSNAVGAVASMFVWQVRSGGKVEPHFGATVSLGTFASISLPMLMSTGMLLLLGWTDVIMLGIFRTSADVGMYRVALRLATLTSISLMAVNSIAGPQFSKYASRQDFEKLRDLVQLSAKVAFWLAVPILAVFIFGAVPVLGWFGSEFHVASLALVILSGGQFVNAACGSVGTLLDMTGNQRIFRNIVFAGAVLNIGLNAVMVPRFGLNGAAWSTAISMVFWNLSSAVYVRRRFGFWPWRFI